jgi:hypothetical protein
MVELTLYRFSSHSTSDVAVGESSPDCSPVERDSVSSPPWRNFVAGRTVDVPCVSSALFSVHCCSMR